MLDSSTPDNLDSDNTDVTVMLPFNVSISVLTVSSIKHHIVAYSIQTSNVMS